MFTSGGSESNDSAFKTARYYWKRKGKPGKYKVIARKGSYHGVTLAATFATGLVKYHTMFGPAVEGFVHIRTKSLSLRRRIEGGRDHWSGSGAWA